MVRRVSCIYGIYASTSILTPDFSSTVIWSSQMVICLIAEKFDAILQRFELTGRMKDFYDIYYLSRTFDFDGAKLQAAIFETLQRRGTPYDRDSFKRVVALADDEDILYQIMILIKRFCYGSHILKTGKDFRQKILRYMKKSKTGLKMNF